VFCEKPLATSAAQAMGVASAAYDAGVVHAMDFLFPEIAAWQKARELLQSSAVGRVRHIAVTWRVETFSYGVGATTGTWKKQAADGGGTLNNLEWLFGPIEGIRATLTPRHAEVEARGHITLEFAAGHSGEVSVAADAFLGSGHRLEVYGDAGTLVLDNPTSDHARGFTLSLGTRTRPRHVAVDVNGDDAYADGRVYPVTRIASRFVDAIATGRRMGPDLVDGVRTQRLLDAVRLADRVAAWQPVAPQ
jgi:predicted dehydrogenase